MAEQRILHPQYRRQLEPTKYPFADSASLTNRDGVFLPETVFLDAALHPIDGEAGLRLSQIVAEHDTCEIWIGTDVIEKLAVASFDPGDPPDNVRLVDLQGRPAGLLISEASRLGIFQSWPQGTTKFQREETEFAVSCCLPMPGVGLRGFLLEDGTVLTGDVWLVGDDGVVLTPDLKSNTAPACEAAPAVTTTIRVDVVGDPLFRRRLCTNVFSTPRVLQQVTVRHGDQQITCRPDSRGELSLTAGGQDAADSVLRIRVTPVGLQFEAVGEVLENARV